MPILFCVKMQIMRRNDVELIDIQSGEKKIILF